ncbi:MAG: hypothetical protein IAF94_12920 [Pirellulaceae bacterium]|nr:hypothetical protein [Pirellulaceae bacterium]
MATAAATSRSAPFRLPLWLGRLHSWWFMGQVSANLVAAWFIIRLVSEMDWAELGLGLLVGQGFLLSAWLALGGLPNVVRFISVLLVTLAGALAVADQGWYIPNLESWLEQASQVFIVCFFMVLLFHGLLLPLRWLLGWRLDFDPAYHSREKTGRLQVGVVHFLGWTTFLAIPCAIIRLMPQDNLAEIVTICLSMSAMALPVAATSALAVVGNRSWRCTLLAVAVFAIMLTAEVYMPGLVFDENYLQFNLGIVAVVAGNLVVLRLLGMKLFSVVPQAAHARSGGEIPVKQPHFHVQPTTRQAAGAAGS